jgi:hypothetical protein
LFCGALLCFAGSERLFFLSTIARYHNIYLGCDFTLLDFAGTLFAVLIAG